MSTGRPQSAINAAQQVVTQVLGPGSGWALCETLETAGDRHHGEVTMPGHDVDYIEHDRGHARAEYARTREGTWVIRADAAYVAERFASGTIDVVTRRGRTKTVRIERLGTPFQTVSGHRLVYVTPVPEVTAHRRTRKTTPAEIPGALPCDGCGALRTTRFPAVDRAGQHGMVCVRCDALDESERDFTGTTLAQAA